MAEEFRLDQVLGDGRHVQRDELILLAGAVAMQRMRHQLLSRAGFSIDQHRDVRLRESTDCAENLLHGRRFADDVFAALQHRGRDFHILFPGMFQRPHRHGHGFVDVEWLGQVLEGATAVGRHGAVQVGVGRHDDHRQLRVLIMHGGQQIQPVDAWHADVADDGVGTLFFQAVQKVLTILEALCMQPGFGQGFFQYPADGLVVIQYPDGVVLAHDCRSCVSANLRLPRALGATGM